MGLEVTFPEIVTKIASAKDPYLEHHHQRMIRYHLKKILPPSLFFKPGDLLTDKKIGYLQENLPQIEWIYSIKAPSLVTITMLCKKRKGAAKFFQDIISRWMFCDKSLNLESFYAVDFSFYKLLEQTFTISELSFYLEREEDIKKLKLNKRHMSSEISLGVSSTYHANRILEFKGHSLDAKTALIQEKIGALIQKRNDGYDKTIVAQMQKFLVTCDEGFRQIRDPHHISRIISVTHLLGKLLLQKMGVSPDKRHIIIKILKTQILEGMEKKGVLGLLIGLNFFHQNEVFEDKHLIKGIKKFIFLAEVVKKSFIVDRNNEKNMQIFYLEIQKSNQADFSLDEVKSLKVDLPEHLKNCIESKNHPVFMPRNEEEIVRHMITLSNQLKYVQDIPQVIISFDNQQDGDLCFTVILLRLLKENTEPAKNLFQSAQKEARFVEDRVRQVGCLRRKYPKEAVVFRIYLRDQKFLKEDNSVDLNQARRFVLDSIEEVFGEVRDYNGGMISKQNEHFLSLKKELKEIGASHESLLEKFFYEISPYEKRSTLEIVYLKNFFLVFLRLLQKNHRFFRAKVKSFFKRDERAAYAVFSIKEAEFEKKLKGELKKKSYSVVMFGLEYRDEHFCGFMLLTDDLIVQKQFIEHLREISLELLQK